MKYPFEVSKLFILGLVALLTGCAETSGGSSAFSSQPELVGKTFRTLVCRVSTPKEAKAFRERTHTRKYLPDETTFVNTYQMIGTREFNEKEGRLVSIAAIEKYSQETHLEVGDIVDVVYEEPKSKDDFAKGIYPHVVRVVCSHDDATCLESAKGTYRGEITHDTPI
jgi:hypothetical protein